MLETLLNRESIPAAVLTVAHSEKISKRVLVRDIAKIILNINLKTIWFNFSYFNFNDAIKFPIFVKQRACLNKLRGRVRINGPVYPGMILVGFGHVGHFDKSSSKLIWDVEGEVIFNGPALLKFGSKIVVGKDACLELGDKFRISPDSAIICYKKIVFGDNCRVSWDATIMDTDFHKIKSLKGEHLNPPKEITIGNHVWIGAKASIMKGASVPDDCIIATGSIVNKPFDGRHQIIAGIPAKVVKTEVTWEG